MLQDAKTCVVDTEADEAMDDKTNDMMVEWFKLVRKRNELVREESAVIYQSVLLHSLILVGRTVTHQVTHRMRPHHAPQKFVRADEARGPGGPAGP